MSEIKYDVKEFMKRVKIMKQGHIISCPCCNEGKARMIEESDNITKFACDSCDMYFELVNN